MMLNHNKHEDIVGDLSWCSVRAIGQFLFAPQIAAPALNTIPELQFQTGTMILRPLGNKTLLGDY